jgi:signal transduction histidine kinase
MGVPLHTGAETIGVLSLGSRDPAVLYTSQQRDFLQAVADQAAGAIAKARLLEETELRARQLASLNDIARSLVSTLELEPLLDQILSSAVEILDCEAGSLFLVDEETGELVFKVTAGPVAQDLAGQRLPPGTGLVGKAVDLGEALIANKVHEEAGWFGQTDADTGFTTRGLLVVPLQIKDRIIGVIEVINKRNQTPFAPDDQELLTVFTGQAAVAIENARLYTLTDQALAARVDELSVMQRVDRELNTSLEVGHAMRIALDWSVRQSGSDAGLVGLVAGDQLQIIAHHGYAPPPTEQLTLESLPVLQEATLSGTSRLCNPTENGAQAPLLPAANSQLAVPIRREAQVIGLLLLESAAAAHFQQDMIDFLTRLSDHAAIAISNAQLYSEVQEANLAKSDFVSFVSHELKTPMTSIKGYADLLANEAVGPITDAQANFLATIRSNVNRMATLVSDLTDISRIEAGRLRLEFGVVSMAEVVEEVVRSTLQQVEEKEQSLRVEVPYRLPSVWGDRTRLIQIVTNLVSNAHKYTPRGGEIIIRARRTANHWDRQGAPQVVHLSVEDNGIGIKEQDHAQIFQKFFRSEDQKAREAPGTGLGLNITKNLVEMQRGRIWFDSVYREGTTFHFTIPVVEEDLQPDESNQDG